MQNKKERLKPFFLYNIKLDKIVISTNNNG